MARRELLHWEQQLGKSLKPCRPGAAKPYFISVQRDVPVEVFNMILKLATTNLFCTQLRETRSVVTLKITNVAKLVSLLSRVNSAGADHLERADILFRKSTSGTFQAVLSEKKPFVLKFYKSRERVTIAMHYGHWNKFGFPQHS